jgi:type IV secretory pathway VirB2 component (pilin)
LRIITIAQPMNIAPQQGACGVVLGDEVIAIVQEPARAAGTCDLVQPPDRIVAEGSCCPATASDEAVLDIVDEGVGPVGGQVAVSLFDARSDAVLDPVAGMVTATLAGDFAISLCVIAVAIIGLMLMSGRLAVREGLRVVIGCFVLLGAPLLENGINIILEETVPVSGSFEPSTTSQPSQLPLPAADYDPYAGASLRQN